MTILLQTQAGEESPSIPLRLGGREMGDDSEDQVDFAAISARLDLVIRELGGDSRVHLAVFAGRPLTDTSGTTQMSDGTLLRLLVADLYA